MAVLNNPQDEDQQQPGGSPIINPGVGASGPTTPANANPQQKGSSSGRFVNLQSYLNANKNFDTAGAISGKAQEKSQQTQQNIQGGLQQFGEQVKSSTPAYNQEVSSSFSSDPTKFLQNDAQKSALQKIAAGYQGPKALDSSGYQQQVGQLQNLNDLGQSEQGRYQVLKGLFGKPTYTSGQQKLDQLLLQRQPDSIGRVQAGLSSAAGSAQQALAGAQQQAQQQAAQAQQEAEAARARTQSEIAGQYGNTYGDVEKQLRNQQAAQAQTVEDASKAFRSGNISDDLFNNINLAGENKASVQNLVNEANSLGINPAEYISIKNAQQANLQTAANSDQAARLSALQQIAGLAGTQVGQGQTWNPQSFNLNALTSSFNRSGLQQAIGQIRENQAKEAARQQQEAINKALPFGR